MHPSLPQEHALEYLLHVSCHWAIYEAIITWICVWARGFVTTSWNRNAIPRWMSWAVQPDPGTHTLPQPGKAFLLPSILWNIGDIRKKLLDQFLHLSCASSTCNKAGPLTNLDGILFPWLENYFCRNSSIHMKSKVPRDKLGFSLCFHLLSASWKPAENGKALIETEFQNGLCWKGP